MKDSQGTESIYGQTSIMRFFLLMLYGTIGISFAMAGQEIHYELQVPVDNKENFKVVLTVPTGALADSVYHFVAYAPGVHQKLDFGRLVTSFNAYDDRGNSLVVKRIGTNDWHIKSSNQLKKIEYEIGDTFDLPATETLVHPQAGTGISTDYAVINPHAVFGYFQSLLTMPIRLDIVYPANWKMGSSLIPDADGSLFANSYKDLLDAPIMIGNLSSAKMEVGGIDVEVFVYSPNDSIDASRVLEVSTPVLESATRFIGFAPVSRYVLLVYLHSDEAADEMPSLNYWGALEHGNSSTYALPAKTEMLPYLKNMIAHEFLHILSPLNLHSQSLIASDYSNPVNQDDHLWLYEGVTEWATHIMQLRSENISLDEYLNVLSGMIRRSRTFENPYSLLKLSNEWHREDVGRQYGNIYQLGALTATILDIRLLRLSNGRRGLREVYLEFIKKYGKDKPFDNATFFDEFIKNTHPEIETFIKSHILSYTPFNFDEEFSPIGIAYLPMVPEGAGEVSLGFTLGVRNNEYIVEKVLSPDTLKVKVKVRDKVLSGRLSGKDILDTEGFLKQIHQADVNDTYQLWVIRGDKKVNLQGTVLQNAKYDVFMKREEVTTTQKDLHQRWISLNNF
ncbi:hypothetical protein G5B00_17340 [Parapedobacter sp. SGR-10]|uniref:M61 family metallopeptidase n=1 Tax=Parapedobacter sp. SGR-10 TaxID=2710879 RepID=UPI0013CFB22A|nr:hypothetical protein [Parapedobacter sp. SGR-10]NGF58270.1 hypothetical protein [Parapedobacter sp. SGR-10]